MNNSLHKRLWLIFAQAATICMALIFALRIFYPNLLNFREPVVVVKQADPISASSPAHSYSHAAKKSDACCCQYFH
jgi:serine protease DegQ